MNTCLVCGDFFEQTRTDRKCCSKVCTTKISYDFKKWKRDQDADKSKSTYLEWRRQEGPFCEPKQLYIEKRETVRQFFLSCQAKKWQLDRFDILHLLMVYADLFPHRHTSEKDLEDPEKFYTKCVIRIKNKMAL
jgi:hypothetical protein